MSVNLGKLVSLVPQSSIGYLRRTLELLGGGKFENIVFLRFRFGNTTSGIWIGNDCQNF